MDNISYKKIISELGLTENELNCLFEKCTAKTEEEQTINRYRRKKYSSCVK